MKGSILPRLIRIIRPSGVEAGDLLARNIPSLESAGFKVKTSLRQPTNIGWPFTSGSIEDRRSELLEALLDDECDIILCCRGGYGASDLLPGIPWEDLRKAKPKVLVGFSDISALHSAIYSKLNWPSIHGPMPGTLAWGGQNSDVTALLKILNSDQKTLHLPLRQVIPTETQGVELSGWLFGGCFSVLTSLIGTPYFPRDLTGAVLFLEDTSENPGRLCRMWQQWIQSNSLSGVQAVVWGNFSQLQDENITLKAVIEYLGRLFPSIPHYQSEMFGHSAVNFPLGTALDVTVNKYEMICNYQKLFNL